jgi:hypothetical protein
VLNADVAASVRSISIPIPIGVAVTNVGFHDVVYHSGDGIGGMNVDGTDWVGTLASGRLTWSCPTFAQDPNANAIRWRTTYNFRFDAFAPPSSASVDFEEFNPAGSPLFSATLIAPSSIGGGGVFCVGDGSGSPCPCANSSALGAGEGCASSLGFGGRLTWSGTPSISADSVTLWGSGMPSSSALYFQGSTAQNGGLGTAFGDGFRCAGGSVVRLRTLLNVSGASQYPSMTGDPSLSTLGGASGGQLLRYQIWYRNAAAFCTPSTFNLTNGVAIAWTL